MVDVEFEIIYFTVKFFGIAILILLTSFLFKYVMVRRKYCNIFPSTLQCFVNIFSCLSSYSFNEKYFKGYPQTTIFMQYVSGLYHLYKDKNMFCLWVSYVPFLGVTSPEAIKEVLGGKKLIDKAWFYKMAHCWLENGLLTSVREKWESRRKLLTPAFHFEILEHFLPIINTKSKVLVEKWKNEHTKEFTDVIPFLTMCSLDVICETTLGLDISSEENNAYEYAEAVEKVTKGLVMRVANILHWFDFTFFITIGRSYKKDLQLLHNFSSSAIQRRTKEFLLNRNTEKYKNSKRKPLMEILLEHYFKKDGLSENDIREEVDIFTMAGHETVSLTLTWALFLIGLDKEIQSNIHKELDRIFGTDLEKPITKTELSDMKYLECVIKETLRLYPPVPLFAREAKKDTVICGFPIPYGTPLMICPYQLHRNENLYPNPEVFDPERFTPENSAGRHPYAYIPFSAGPRNCIGQRFSIIELKIVLANILRNFRIESLDPRDKVLPKFEPLLRPSIPVRIQIRQRNSS